MDAPTFSGVLALRSLRASVNPYRNTSFPLPSRGCFVPAPFSLPLLCRRQLQSHNQRVNKNIFYIIGVVVVIIVILKFAGLW